MFIVGYAHLPGLLGICLAIATRTPYVLFSDAMNVDKSSSRIQALLYGLRGTVRRLIFSTCVSVLTCGTLGRTTTLAAGCSPNKVLDFPYVVSVRRIQAESRSEPECKKLLADVAQGKLVIFFSGRMIERKGLPTLLKALVNVEPELDWVLWCEGDGPRRADYENTATDLGISDRCRFLGFCQMTLHSWLLQHSDIIVVPSISDRWGIVVDEGMQLGKAVVSTSATGSARDRIIHGVNGLICPPGDPESLSNALKTLLTNPLQRKSIGKLAQGLASRFSPEANAQLLVNLVKNNQGLNKSR